MDPTIQLFHKLQLISVPDRSTRSQMFFKIDVLKDFAIFRGKNLCWSLFLVKLQDFRPTTLSNRDSNRDVFLWILRNFLEQLLLRNTSGGYCCHQKFIQCCEECQASGIEIFIYSIALNRRISAVTIKSVNEKIAPLCKENSINCVDSNNILNSNLF